MEIGAYARDEDLVAATLADGQARHRLYRHPDVAVVLGSGSKPERELHLQACEADGVQLLRRRGGGCAVVLDPGNLVLSAALAVQGIGDNRRHFRRLGDWLVDGLQRLGLSVQQGGISDLVLDGRKVGGSCIYRTRGLLFYSTTLLLDPDVDRMERYLQHPPREPDYRQGRTHREFVGRLPVGEVDGFRDDLERALGDSALCP